MESNEFGEFDMFNSDLRKLIQRMMSEFEEAAKNRNLKGKWEINEIGSDGVKGYRLQGHFGPGQPGEPLDPFNPFEPLNPMRRRPGPQRPFGHAPDIALKEREASEPLTDVFDNEKTIKVYFEVRGEHKDDIQLNVTADKVEVKAKNFYKMINLPTRNIDLEKASSKYKNGVLEVTIPKKKTPKKDKHKISID